MQTVLGLHWHNRGEMVVVRVTGHKLNPQLLRWLGEHPAANTRCVQHNNEASYRRTCWRLRDRLSDRDVVRLIIAFRTGIATNELAERFGINIKGVRKLLREHGVWGFKLNPELRGDFDKYFSHFRDDQTAA